jgi:proteasome lid subunit RPN8/RPN11
VVAAAVLLCGAGVANAEEEEAAAVVLTSTNETASVSDALLLAACMNSALCVHVYHADETLRTSAQMPSEPRPAWLADVMRTAQSESILRYRDKSRDELVALLAMVDARVITVHAHPQGLRCPSSRERALYSPDDARVMCVCPPGETCHADASSSSSSSYPHRNGAAGPTASPLPLRQQQQQQQSCSPEPRGLITCLCTDETPPPVVLGTLITTILLASAAVILLIVTILVRAGAVPDVMRKR